MKVELNDEEAKMIRMLLKHRLIGTKLRIKRGSSDRLKEEAKMLDKLLTKLEQVEMF